MTVSADNIGNAETLSDSLYGIASADGSFTYTGPNKRNISKCKKARKAKASPVNTFFSCSFNTPVLISKFLSNTLQFKIVA